MKTEFNTKYGEWALVTGASSGIGKALAAEIAAKGLHLVLVARGEAELEKAAAELRSRYRIETLVLAADLSRQSGIDEVILKTQTLDIGLLVLSAGIENNGSFMNNDLEKELQVVQLNIVSTLKLTHYFTKRMESRQRGGVLFVSSLTALMPSPYFSNYAASKSYVFSLATSLYGELKPKGIDVSVLSPGVTNTPMSENTGIDWSRTPVKIMPAEDVAREALLHFGKKLSIVPGTGNKFMAFLAKKVLSYSALAVSNQKMMQKALHSARL